MKNVSIIQVVLIGVSIIAIAAAVIMFATFRGGTGGSKGGPVILWGTIPQDTFEMAIQNLQSNDVKIDGLQYIEKSPETLDSELLTAIAEGRGPDLVLLNEKQILTNRRRMQTIPFDSFPIRDYQDLFFEEASLLLSKDGILGFPFLVDPLVLYYNRNTLSDAGFSKPPETWTDILALAPTLTQKDSSFNISKSTIALGAFDNINNVKDIYWTLVLQAGNPVIKREVNPEDQTEVYKTIFTENLNYTLSPAYAATNFFTQFSNPTKTVYSWNRSLQSSQNMFIAGDLAFYIGRASELPTLRRLNPNLNFDITLVPQSQNSTRKVTYGSMYVLTVPRTAKNLSGAMRTIGALTSKPVQMEFSKILGIPSVRRDILATSDATDPYQSVFNRSAVISQGILEPNPSQTTNILTELIEMVVSGQLEISEALTRANEKLILLLSNE